MPPPSSQTVFSLIVSALTDGTHQAGHTSIPKRKSEAKNWSKDYGWTGPKLTPQYNKSISIVKTTTQPQHNPKTTPRQPQNKLTQLN